ncbi:MAG TPA: hypothetical protein VGX50_08290 [Longimicrobium sp.]|nr:hypothetical protein [Longimicrobium sp.]
MRLEVHPSPDFNPGKPQSGLTKRGNGAEVVTFEAPVRFSDVPGDPRPRAQRANRSTAMRLAAAFLLLLSQMGCAALQQTAPAVRPSLFLDQVPLHGAILNPAPPPYGLDGGAGCIPQGEFRIELTDLAIAEDGRLRIAGSIQDADPQRGGPVMARIARRVGGTAVPVLRFAADRFDVLVDVDEGAVLAVERIGYRTLQLDLARLAAVAERRAAAQ